MFKKYRIDYLLFGGSAAFIVTLLTIVIWIAYSYSAQQMVQNTSYYQQGLLNELYNKVDIQMKSIEQISLTATRNTNLLDDVNVPGDKYSNYKKRKEMESFLAQLTFSTPDIESVHFYIKQTLQFEPQGPVKFIEHDLIKEEVWYNPAIENNDFGWIGEHDIRTVQGEKRVISFVRKVYSVAGDYRGLLLLNIKASSIRKLIESHNPAANRILLDSGGRLITMIGGDTMSQDQVEAYLENIKGESGYMKTKSVNSGLSDSSEHLMVWAKHFDRDWTLIESTPWKDITGGSFRLAMVLLLAGGSAMLIALCFNLFFSRQFVKPIGLLLHEMSRNSVNVNKVSLPAGYRNEFGALFSGYRRLIERIQELYASLEDQYRRQKEAEIKALQAMINPHFLYNTLDQLNWMAIAGGQEKMSTILELMGKMFRIGLSNGESVIIIRDELLHMECYMQIQQIRLGEQFVLRVDVPETIRDLYIPKMTLQPFIENAIMHGFHGKKEGTIEVCAEITKNAEVVFRITDNGNGLRDNWQEPKKRKTGGYGIRNVRERIDIYFGSSYGLELMPNMDGPGTTVHIRIPVLNNKEEQGDAACGKL